MRAPNSPGVPRAMAELPVEEPDVPEDVGMLVTVVWARVADEVPVVPDGVAPAGGDRTYCGGKAL